MKKNTTNNKDGFSVSDSYFKESNNAILNTISNLKTSDNEIDLGFTTPKNYFEDSKEATLDELAETNKTKSTSISAFIKYSLAIAASVVLVFVITNNLKTTQQSNTIVNVPDTKNTVSPEKNTILAENEQLLSIYLNDNFSDEYLAEYALEDLVFSN